MKGSEIILGEAYGRTAAALVVDGVLDDLIVDSDAPRPGTIYRAKAMRAIKGQGGVFLESPDGTLYLRNAKGVRPGDVMLVQVSGYSEPGKAIPVTDRLLFKSRYAIVTPGAPGLNISRSIRDDEARVMVRDAAEVGIPPETAHGLIVRSSAAKAEAAAITKDVSDMLDLADQVMADAGKDPEKLLDGDDPHTLAWRDWHADAERSGDLQDWLAQAEAEKIPLGHGASMYVEATRALVAVDVNTGTDVSPAAGLKANIAALRALPRSLRVRGLGGQIVVDLAPIPKRDRHVVESALRAALKADSVETSIVGWTPLGHIELSRKRARVPLRELLR